MGFTSEAGRPPFLQADGDGDGDGEGEGKGEGEGFGWVGFLHNRQPAW